MKDNPKYDENAWVGKLPQNDVDIMIKACDIGPNKCSVWFDSKRIIKYFFPYYSIYDGKIYKAGETYIPLSKTQTS